VDKKKQNQEQRNLIGRLLYYFITSHHLFWLPVGFASNITIIYVLLFTEFPYLYVIFPTILEFALVFGVSYFLAAVVYGWWYVNHSGIWKGSMEVWAKANPVFAAMVEREKQIIKN
jgi:hypothetical protein